MSKFLANRTYRMTDEDGNTVVCYVVSKNDKPAALLAFEETKKAGKKLEIDVKPYKSKRSLEQNRLLWVLLGKLAEAMSGKKDRVSTEDAYRIMLEEANVAFDFVIARPETEDMLRKMFRVVRKVGERKVNGQLLNDYQCFLGSSQFNTQQMTELIESVLDKLAELGVYDSEIELARGEYCV